MIMARDTQSSPNRQPTPQPGSAVGTRSRESGTTTSGKCLVLEITGKVGTVEIRRELERTFAAVDAGAPPRILVDARAVRRPLSFFDTLALAQFLVDKRPRYRMAFLQSREVSWPDAFFETFTNNRGLLLKVTQDLGEASAWLRQ
jgi:hypothetical protein